MSRLSAFQERMRKEKVEAVLVSSEINQRYLSGFSYTDGYFLVTRQEAMLITDFRYTEAATAAVDPKEITVLQPDGKMLKEVGKLLKKRGIARVAVEEEEVSITLFDKMKEELGNAVVPVCGASKLLLEQREVKLPEEILAMEKAQAVTDSAFTHILGYITPDKTEREVALELEFFMRSHGAEALAFDTIAVSGDASSLPHGVPRDVKIKKGFFTLDFGAKVDGYCSDMTRTIVIGKADAEMKRLYETVLKAQTTALEQLHAGMTGYEADKIARDIIYGAGYEGCFGHSLGHGVGMFIHEEPRLSASAKTKKLVPGNVVTVEPGIYKAGQYGCRIEDMVAILDNGSIHNFTHSDKRLIEL